MWPHWMLRDLWGKNMYNVSGDCRQRWAKGSEHYVFFNNYLSRHVNKISPFSFNADVFLKFQLGMFGWYQERQCVAVSRGQVSSFDSSPPVPVPLTSLGIPGVHLGFRHFESKLRDSSLSLWRRFVKGLYWFDSSELSTPFKHISFQWSWLGHNLEVEA